MQYFGNAAISQYFNSPPTPPYIVRQHRKDTPTKERRHARGWRGDGARTQKILPRRRLRVNSKGGVPEYLLSVARKIIQLAFSYLGTIRGHQSYVVYLVISILVRVFAKCTNIYFSRRDFRSTSYFFSVFRVRIYFHIRVAGFDQRVILFRDVIIV